MVTNIVSSKFDQSQNTLSRDCNSVFTKTEKLGNPEFFKPKNQFFGSMQTDFEL